MTCRMSSISDVSSGTKIACNTLLAMVNGSSATTLGIPTITISAEGAGGAPLADDFNDATSFDSSSLLDYILVNLAEWSSTTFTRL